MEESPDMVHAFVRGHPREAARVLENLSLRQVAAFVARLPPDLAAALMETLEASTASACLERMEAAPAAEALARVPLEGAAALLRRCRPEARTAILALLPPAPGRHLELLLGCREDTAGALMDPRVLTMPPEVTAAEAVARVSARPEQVTHYIYVVERDRTLAGALSLRELMAGPPEAPVSALMHGDVVRLRMDDSLASVRVHPGWLEFHVLPVLDDQGRFAGALRQKSLRRLARPSGRSRPDQVGAALGELYRIGLAALVESAVGESAAGTGRTRGQDHQ